MSRDSFRKSKGSLKYRNNETVQEEDTEENIGADKDADSDSGNNKESITEEIKYDLSDSGRRAPEVEKVDESMKEDSKYELSESNVPKGNLEDKLQDRTLDQSEELMLAYTKKTEVDN